MVRIGSAVRRVMLGARSPGLIMRFAAVLLLGISSLALASQEPFQVTKVPISESVILKIPGIKRVSITNPAIADVTVIGDDELRVDGLTKGRTTMYVWDPKGRHRYEVVIISQRDDIAGQIREAINLPEISVSVINNRVLLRGYIPSETDRRFATEIARVYQEPVVDLMQVRGQRAYDPAAQIKDLIGIPDIRVEVVLDPNAAMSGRAQIIQGAAGQVTAPTIAAIMLHGTVDDQRDKLKAEAVAHIFAPTVLDYIDVVQPLQVLVQSHILEIGRTTATQYGFNWGTTQVSGTPGQPISVSGSPLQQLRYLENVSNAPHGQGTFFGKSVPENGIAWPWLFDNINPLDPLFVTISWLMNEGKGRLVANPRLVTEAGTQASVTSGFQIPYPSVGALGVPAVQFVQANVTLQIQPDVDHRGNIDNKLTVTVATPDATRSTLVGGTLVPAIATRSTVSEVTVRDGEHIIISGLLQEQDSKTFSKVPFFSRVPFLGNLFTSKDYKTDQSELIVIVTPNLVTGPTRYKTKPAASVQASRWTTDPRMAPKALVLASPPPPGPLPGTSPFGRRRAVEPYAPIDPDSARIKVHDLVEGMKSGLRNGQVAPPLPEQGVGATVPAPAVASAPSSPRKKRAHAAPGMRRSDASPAEEAIAGAQLIGSTRFSQGFGVISAPDVDPAQTAASMTDEIPPATDPGVGVIPAASAAEDPPRWTGGAVTHGPPPPMPAQQAVAPNDKAKQDLQRFYEQLKTRLGRGDAGAQGTM